MKVPACILLALAYSFLLPNRAQPSVTGSCVVLEDAVFSAPSISSRLVPGGCLEVRNARVEGELNLWEGLRTLSVVDSTFTGPIDTGLSLGHIAFTRTKFLGKVDFYLARVESMSFNDCTFEGNVSFHSLETNQLWLNSSVFKGHAVFVAMRVAGLVNLADVDFEKSVDFAGAVLGTLNDPRLRTNEAIDIHWRQFGEEWLRDTLDWATAPVEGEDRRARLEQVELRLRFWQRNFRELEYEADALEVNYRSVELKRKYWLDPWEVEWWASWLLELPNRYGTRPYRPLWISLGVILAFAAIYRLADPFEPRQDKDRHLPRTPLTLFALFFSLETFIPFLDVTSIEDWGWEVASRFRWVVLVERILGVVVSTLAAYSIGSYVL